MKRRPPWLISSGNSEEAYRQGNSSASMLNAFINIDLTNILGRSDATVHLFCYIKQMKNDNPFKQAAGFDKVYNRPGMAFGDQPEPELQKFVSSTAARGKALDLGCGDGRHALFLAKQGFHVTGVDLSEVAIKKLGKISKSQKLDTALELYHLDARDFNYPSDSFDLVVAVTLFDHVTKKDVRPLFNKVERSLKTGGILFIKVHTVKDPGKINGSDKASELSWAIQHYFEPNELKSLLKSKYEIIKYVEYDDLDKSHGRPHFHNFDLTLARKTRRPK